MCSNRPCICTPWLAGAQGQRPGQFGAGFWALRAFPIGTGCLGASENGEEEGENSDFRMSQLQMREAAPLQEERAFPRVSPHHGKTHFKPG